MHNIDLASVHTPTLAYPLCIDATSIYDVISMLVDPLSVRFTSLYLFLNRPLLIIVLSRYKVTM